MVPQRLNTSQKAINMAKIRFTLLPNNFGTKLDINQVKKSQSPEYIANSAVFEAVKAKFTSKKWAEMLVQPQKSKIAFYSKKKRDLGVDSLMVNIIADKFVIAMKSFSNSNDTEFSYFQISQ